MAKSSVDKTQLERPYTFFLFKSLSGIYEAWDENEIELALSRACKLVIFLPNDIKDVLYPDKREIVKRYNKARRTKGVDYYTTHLLRNRKGLEVAQRCLEPFVDQMVRLLDEKGWLERGAMRPRFPTAKKLSVEAIETQ